MKQRLAIKLAMYTILIALAIGTLVSAIEIRQIYQHSTKNIVAASKQLIEITLDAAGEVVYQLDAKIAADLLNGLMQNTLFLDAAIYDELGHELASISRARGEFSGLASLIEIPPAVFEYELFLRNGSELSGKLTATLDVQAGLSEFYDLAILTATSQMLQAFILSLLVFLIVVFVITVPISRLATNLAAIEPASDSRLSIPAGHKNDELGELVDSANRYLNAASQYHSELTYQRQVLQNILDSLQEGVITVDSKGIVSAANRAAENMFGYDTGLSGPLSRVIQGDRNTAAENSGELVFAQDAGVGIQMMGRKKGGQRFPIEASVNSIELADGEHGLWTIRDISDRVKAEKETRELEEQLRQSQKMEAIGTLAGGIAHDFNNMLSGILGFAELALEEAPKRSALHGYLDRVISVANQGAQLVSQILTFSRKQAERKYIVDISKVADECSLLLRQSMPSTVDFSTQCHGSAFTILADETMMHQVVMNLLLNARGALRDDTGRIEMIFDCVDKHVPETVLTRKERSAGGNRERRYVRMTITDNGCGIPDEIVHRVFEPFFTTKEPGAGTGMGLAVVHSIVEKHDGFIEVASIPGETRFTVHLPYVAEDVRAAKQAVEVERSESHGKERILVVDDDKMITKLLADTLAKRGYEVVIRNDGDAALAVYRADPDGFVLVITDQTMQGMSGAELAGDIFSIKADQAIILCTGFSQAITEEQALAMGIRRFLMKPVPIGEICETVRTVINEYYADISEHRDDTRTV